VSDDRKVRWAIIGTVTLVLTLLFFSERVQQELRAEPTAAFVAIEVDGRPQGRFGTVEIPSGTSFKLHAVLEATTRGGERVFFTEATSLLIDGEEVSGSALRPWAGPEKAKILWFSVEGPRPLVSLPEDSSLDSVEFRSLYRPDWPRAWSIPGTVRPVRESATPDARSRGVGTFGTQRYHVRIELFGQSSELIPAATFSSIEPAELPAAAGEFPTVIATLEGGLSLPSRVFGLSQIAMTPAGRQREGVRLNDWYESGLAFSHLLVLRAMVDRADVALDEVTWQPVDLAEGPEWGDASVAPGDLLRAGERIVVIFDDRGTEGHLDYDDLCMDFLEGPKIHRLGEVFSGEGLVEWAALRPATGGRN